MVSRCVQTGPPRWPGSRWYSWVTPATACTFCTHSFWGLSSTRRPERPGTVARFGTPFSSYSFWESQDWSIDSLKSRRAENCAANNRCPRFLRQANRQPQALFRRQPQSAEVTEGDVAAPIVGETAIAYVAFCTNNPEKFCR